MYSSADALTRIPSVVVSDIIRINPFSSSPLGSAKEVTVLSGITKCTVPFQLPAANTPPGSSAKHVI
jgi:hypothetical protein